MTTKLFSRTAYSVAVTTISLLSAAWVMQGQQPKGLVLSNKNFTGGEVTTVEDKYKVATAHYKFGPGARTKWHKHSGGQVVFNEEGTGHHQEKGGPVRELQGGEAHYVKPEVWHWHGSAPGKFSTQLNTTFGDITWGDEVTDAEYNGKVKK
jgi:quercetin dioxygenase-like cupin family protein